MGSSECKHLSVETESSCNIVLSLNYLLFSRHYVLHYLSINNFLKVTKLIFFVILPAVFANKDFGSKFKHLRLKEEGSFFQPIKSNE